MHPDDPRLKNLRPAKPGEVRNPLGRPRLDPDIIQFKKTSYREFITALQKYGAMTRDEISDDLKRPDATMFDLMFGNIVMQAAKGNAVSRQLLIDRLWGKVREVDDSLDVTKLSNVELIEMAKNSLRILEAPTQIKEPIE